MAQKEKIYYKALDSATNVKFNELCNLAKAVGYKFRNQKGSHKTYKHPDHPSMMNFQPDNKNKGMAKPYQVRQLLSAIEQYNLMGEDNV